MQMSYREIQQTCDNFEKFMADKVGTYEFAAMGSMEDVISLTVDDARKYGIVKEKENVSD